MPPPTISGVIDSLGFADGHPAEWPRFEDLSTRLVNIAGRKFPTKDLRGIFC
jgi:hypothetical protein